MISSQRVPGHVFSTMLQSRVTISEALYRQVLITCSFCLFGNPRRLDSRCIRLKTKTARSVDYDKSFVSYTMQMWSWRVLLSTMILIMPHFQKTSSVCQLNPPVWVIKWWHQLQVPIRKRCPWHECARKRMVVANMIRNWHATSVET